MYPPTPDETTFDELGRQLPPPPARPDDPDPAAEATAAVELPFWPRLGLIVVGSVLLLVGVAGLFLPGIQGIVTILVGVAVLSLVSQRAYRFLRWSLGRWPSALERMERLRERTNAWIDRKTGRDEDPGGGPCG